MLQAKVGGLSLHHPHLDPRRKETRMKNVLMRLWKEEEGQDLVEYILLVVLVALGAIAGMTTLAKAVNTAFSSASVNMT
jgi:pilus assembly protein Flp/PilA